LLLRQSQNEIILLEFLLKNLLKLLNITMECGWYRWRNISKILLAAGIVLVTMTICVIPNIWNT